MVLATTAISTVLLMPMNNISERLDAQDKYIARRFNAMEKHTDQRFDFVDQRLDRLTTEVSELRKFGERISRNEERIDIIRQQLQTADAPLL